jgi:hypothetical protein
MIWDWMSEMVARDGIEPPTPAFSGPRSTTELPGQRSHSCARWSCCSRFPVGMLIAPSPRSRSRFRWHVRRAKQLLEYSNGGACRQARVPAARASITSAMSPAGVHSRLPLRSACRRGNGPPACRLHSLHHPAHRGVGAGLFAAGRGFVCCRPGLPTRG